MDVKMQSIDAIGLSVRSSNALHRAGVHTVGDMLERTEEDLSQVRNLGKKSLEEILGKIEEYRNLEAAQAAGMPGQASRMPAQAATTASSVP